MNKHNSKFVFLFLKTLTFGILSASFTLGAAFGETHSNVGWKQAGRNILLRIPPPAETRTAFPAKHVVGFLAKFFKKNSNS